jgi:hypothetical protein
MQTVIEFALLFNLKIQKIPDFSWLISTTPKPLIPGVSIILAPKISHTFQQRS